MIVSNGLWWLMVVNDPYTWFSVTVINLDHQLRGNFEVFQWSVHTARNRVRKKKSVVADRVVLIILKDSSYWWLVVATTNRNIRNIDPFCFLVILLMMVHNSRMLLNWFWRPDFLTRCLYQCHRHPLVGKQCPLRVKHDWQIGGPRIGERQKLQRQRVDIPIAPRLVDQ